MPWVGFLATLMNKVSSSYAECALASSFLQYTLSITALDIMICYTTVVSLYHCSCSSIVSSLYAELYTSIMLRFIIIYEVYM